MSDHMGQHALVLSVFILVITYITSSDVQTPDVSLQEHVKKLDEKLAEMQSHSQAQEQKYSAVLASLLSQLTQTTDELGDLKTSHNETLLASNRRDAELSDLWTRHNELLARYNETVIKLESTLIKCEENDAQLSKLSASHNETALKLETTSLNLKEKYEELSAVLESQNKTVLLLESSYLNLKEKDAELLEGQNATVVELEKSKDHLDLNGYIGYQGRLSEEMHATVQTPMHFDDILYSAGSHYDHNTGTFTVPLKGTYLIWIDLTYNKTKTPFVFKIYKDRGYPIGQAFGIRSDLRASTSTTTMAHLHKGDYIWVAPTVNVSMDRNFCSFGIVLLNAH